LEKDPEKVAEIIAPKPLPWRKASRKRLGAFREVSSGWENRCETKPQ
jgi:hypothetical protein